MGVPVQEESSDAAVDHDEYPHTRCGWRHGICATIFLIVVVCYADRTNIGIVLAQTDLAAIPHDDKGFVLSSFFIGYMITQIPGGYLARRYGAKPIFLVAAVTWTIADVLTPFAAQLGVVPLVLVRIGMGLGEGMTFPTQSALASFWVPTHEMGFLVMFMTSGQDIGSVAANIITPHLVEQGAWLVFAAWGSLAILWCILYGVLWNSAPELHGPCRRSGEAAWIVRHRKTGPFEDARHSRESMLPLRLLRAPCVWAIVIAHFGFNYGWYVCLSWLPTYFKGVFDLKLADNPVTLALPYVASWAGSVVSGRFSDWLVARRGLRVRHVRKLMQVCGAVGCALFFQIAVRSTDHVVASVWVSIALFFGKTSSSGYWVNMIDVCPDSAGQMMGLSNTIATIPGIIGQPITQAILNRSGGENSMEAWCIVFGIGGLVSVGTSLIFALLADDQNIDADVHAQRLLSLQGRGA